MAGRDRSRQRRRHRHAVPHQYLISPHWQRGKALSILEAADLDGNGVPDLWAVTPDGVARAYLISHLSAKAPAEIEAQKPQNLS